MTVVDLPGSHGGSIRLRALRHDDFDRVLELERELFGSGAWTYGMLAEELAAWGRWYIVAEESVPEGVGRDEAGRTGAAGVRAASDRVIGYAGLWFDGDVTQVMTVGVDAAYQGHGVGRALTERLIARSAEIGATAVLLEVRTDNAPALALYQSLGFEILRVRPRYYQPENKDAYSMRLVLPPPPRADAGVRSARRQTRVEPVETTPEASQAVDH
jgi:ribosomal-protein-alanine N-acetyltransferase